MRTHGADVKRFRHPLVGDLTLAYEELAVTAEPGSPSAERLALLAAWTKDPVRG